MNAWRIGAVSLVTTGLSLVGWPEPVDDATGATEAATC